MNLPIQRIVLSFLSTLLDIIATVSACPTNWLRFGDHCYGALPHNTSFTNIIEARELCYSQQSDLASFESALFEQSVYSELFTANKQVTSPHYIFTGFINLSGNLTWLYDYTAVSDDRRVITSDDNRCFTAYASTGDWKTTIKWEPTSCCFQMHNISVAVCKKHSNTSFLPTKNELLEHICYGDCPSGWFYLDNRCYSLTQFNEDFNSTNEARSVCLQQSADLPALRTNSSEALVVNLLQSKASSSEAIYLGLIDLEATGNFVYTDSTNLQITDHTNWNKDRCCYRDTLKVTGDCVVLVSDGSVWSNRSTVSWLTVPCCMPRSISTVVCEKPALLESALTTANPEEDIFARHCLKGIDECVSSPCMNGATCVDLLLAFNCTCPDGYSGTLCENVVENCHSNPCLNNGSCTTDPKGYVCACGPAYSGRHCEQAISCPPDLPLVVNATSYSDGDITYGARINYTCLIGYKFPDMTTFKIITCSGNSWDTIEDACEEHCDFVPAIQFGISAVQTRVGTTLHYSCIEGYRFADNITGVNTTCLEGNVWTSDVSDIKCEPIYCPQLVPLAHQRLSSRDTAYHSVVVVTCRFGYMLEDGTTSRSVKCVGDGHWSADLPACKVLQCASLSPISFRPELTTYNSYTIHNCTNGTRTLDGNSYVVVKCESNQHWDPDIGECTELRCLPVPFVANATASSSDASVGNTVSFTCVPGHRFMPSIVDSFTMTCTADLTWQPPVAPCRPVYCSPVPMAGNHSTANSTLRLLGTMVRFSCDVGHYFSDDTSSVVITCREDGTWNASVMENCQPVECPQPSSIKNGVQTTTDIVRYVYQTRVHYLCDDGFLFIDGKRKRTLQCTADGTWDESDISCKVDRCTPVPEVENASPDTTNTSWYSRVTFSCIKGHEWPAEKMHHYVVCRNDGTWNETALTIPRCKAKVCPLFPPSAFHSLNTTVHIYGTYVLRSCNTGYELSDGRTTAVHRCTENATWEQPVTDACRPVVCPALLDVENATRDSNYTEYSSMVVFTCLLGYQFPDRTKNKSIVCTANATWTDYPDHCSVVYCPPVPWWSEMEFNSTDNEFLAGVSYSCKEGFAFKDSAKDTAITKTSICTMEKQWIPPLENCIAIENIAATIHEQTVESPQGVSIGTVAIVLLAVSLGGVVLLDLDKMFSDLQRMRSNVKCMLRQRRAKTLSDSNANIKKD